MVDRSFTPSSHPAAPSACEFWLEIRRGRTRHPRRPIHADRFLIGGGSNCHLQLGGDGMPMLHSILLVEGNQVQIDAVVPTPALQVNGELRRDAELVDGSVFAIGGFEFALQAVAIELPDSSDVLPTEDEDLSRLTVDELLGCIEREEAAVARFDDSRRAGGVALLQAALAASPVHGGGAVTFEESSAEVLRELNRLSQDLEQRAKRLIAQERGLHRTGGPTQTTKHPLTIRLEPAAEGVTLPAPLPAARASA